TAAGRGFRVFFFSSRRRHTRSLRDWSSDVCSSDLVSVTARWWSRKHPSYPFPSLKSLYADGASSGISSAPIRAIRVTRALQPMRSEERRVGKEGSSQNGAER